jgi:mitochondrial import inner membrane translocase subunit TIM22
VTKDPEVMAEANSDGPPPEIDPPPSTGESASPPSKPKKPKKEYKVVQMPTAEQIQQEDFMNNCAIRAVVSGVMGSMLGVVFGIFMGTMDTTVRPSSASKPV